VSVRKASLAIIAIASTLLSTFIGDTTASASDWNPRLTKLVAEAQLQTTQNIFYASGAGHDASPAPLGSPVDCSGFIREMYSYAFGVDIGNGSGDDIVRLSGEFTQTATPVVGDVVLFGSNGQAPAYHAGIYIGMIDGYPADAAASETGKPILIQQWYNRDSAGDFMGYWHYNGASAADSGPITPPLVPTAGALETATQNSTSITVSGFTYDTLSPAASNRADIFIDGKFVARVPSNRARPDINRVFHIPGNHGFVATVPVTPGTHHLTVASEPISPNSVINQAGNPRTITIAKPAVVAHLDTLSSLSIRRLTVAGWTFDPQHKGNSQSIQVIVDGRLAATLRDTAPRVDVNAKFGTRGNHGFTASLALSSGGHAISIRVLPVAGSSSAPVFLVKNQAVSVM